MFGCFTLDPTTCILSHNGIRLSLSERLLVTLLYLVEHQGRVVERHELLQALWPGRQVEDGNLARAVSSLRLALKDLEGGPNLITTVPGRGYRFVEHVLFAPVSDRLSPLSQEKPFDCADDTVAAERTHVDEKPERRVVRHQRPGWALSAFGLVALLVFSSLVVWRANSFPLSGPAVAPPALSIAVLPFVNSSGDAKLDYVSDGVSEEIINALGRIGPLRVAASRSSFSFKGKSQTVEHMARALNVRLILEGSLQQDARSAHVTTQLIDATTGYEIWSQVYDGDAAQTLTLERDIAQSVAKSLKIVLVGNDLVDLDLGGTSNEKAFDAYLTGIASLRASRDNASPAAIAAFGDAIGFDRNYALAYAHRAHALAFRYATSTFPDAASRSDTLRQARADAATAIAIAPNLGAGRAALADIVRFSLSGMAQGLAEIERALSLSPNDTDVLLDYAAMEVDAGHFAAGVSAAERAAALDPLTPLTYILAASIFANARHYDLAISALDHAKALDAGVLAADYGLYGFIKISTGEMVVARQICSGRRNFYDLACLAVADHALGLQQEAETALAQLHTAIGESGAYTYAHIAAAWGRTEEAQKWLAAAYTSRDPGLIFMKVDPALESIHTAPVFQDVESKIGFPQ